MVSQYQKQRDEEEDSDERNSGNQDDLFEQQEYKVLIKKLSVIKAMQKKELEAKSRDEVTKRRMLESTNLA